MGGWPLLPDLCYAVISEVEFEPMLLSELDQSDLVRRGTLIKYFCASTRSLFRLRHALVSCTQQLEKLYDKGLLMLNPKNLFS